MLIVDAGGAGLSAAVGSGEKKAGRVLVIDRAAIPFANSTSYSAGAFNAAVTQSQRDIGITSDKSELFAKEIMLYGGNVCTEEPAMVYARNSGGSTTGFAKRASAARSFPILHSVSCANTCVTATPEHSTSSSCFRKPRR